MNTENANAFERLNDPDSHRVGGLIVGGIDNVLYPILVGNRLKLHTVLAFIALVGGLIVFGLSGLILGPVALTVTQLLLEIWRSRTADAPPVGGSCQNSAVADERKTRMNPQL